MQLFIFIFENHFYTLFIIFMFCMRHVQKVSVLFFFKTENSKKNGRIWYHITYFSIFHITISHLMHVVATAQASLYPQGHSHQLLPHFRTSFCGWTFNSTHSCPQIGEKMVVWRHQVRGIRGWISPRSWWQRLSDTGVVRHQTYSSCQHFPPLLWFSVWVVCVSQYLCAFMVSTGSYNLTKM